MYKHFGGHHKMRVWMGFVDWWFNNGIIFYWGQKNLVSGNPTDHTFFGPTLNFIGTSENFSSIFSVFLMIFMIRTFPETRHFFWPHLILLHMSQGISILCTYQCFFPGGVTAGIPCGLDSQIIPTLGTLTEYFDTGAGFLDTIARNCRNYM